MGSTFALWTVDGALGVRLSIAGAVDTEVLTRQRLIAVTSTWQASLLGSTVKLASNAMICTPQRHSSNETTTSCTAWWGWWPPPVRLYWIITDKYHKMEAFTLTKWIRRYVYNASLIILFLVWCKPIHFWRRYEQKNDFHIIVHSDLDIWPLDLKFVSLFTLVQRYVAIKLELSTAFLLRDSDTLTYRTLRDYRYTTWCVRLLPALHCIYL